jgi:hypothetical protein
LLLFSGLVPGSGCLIVFLMVYYTLFVAIVIAIFNDIKHHNLGISIPNIAATTH